ncbi:MAG: secretin and TonB N-terminal domain-containing protein [Pseudomonadota bacterium]
MNRRTLSHPFLVLTILLIAGCATSTSSIDIQDDQAVRDEFRQTAKELKPSLTIAPGVQGTRRVVDGMKDDTARDKRYSFVARDLPIERACRLFGKTYGLNIVVDKDVTGTVSVDLTNLPFDEVMESLLGANGYYWERRGNIVYVKSWETRTFSIDYIRLVRSGSGSSQAQVSSSASSDDSGDENTAGTMTIQQSDKVDFWSELEEQLNRLVSEEGRLLVNRLAGTVQVTDQHQRVEEVATFIEQLNESIFRQVDIDVRLVEVTLSNDASLGIDWSRFVRNGDGEFVGGNLSTIILSAAGGQTALPPTVDLEYNNIENGLNTVSAVLQALEEQGDVSIVSQPHIRTLNNQSALIKVGTDRTFFRKEQLTDATSAGSQTFSTDVPQVVTEGIVLSITPQISRDGWVTLDVSPVVTRVSSVSEVLDDNGNVQSTAPNLDISQASSLVRARSGETVVIGGLIQNQQTETVRAVPGLGSLPVLGRLFQSRYTSDAKKELIMLVTPRLVAQ